MLVDLNTIGIKVKIKNNIIQCYTRDSSFLSDEERSAMKRLREMNPDWNYFFLRYLYDAGFCERKLS